MKGVTSFLKPAVEDSSVLIGYVTEGLAPVKPALTARLPQASAVAIGTPGRNIWGSK